MTLDVVVGDRTKIFADQYGGGEADWQRSPAEATQMKFGMSIQPLRPGNRQQMGFKGNGGALVASVETGSFADDIGLAKGDIIVELNRQPVNSPEDSSGFKAP